MKQQANSLIALAIGRRDSPANATFGTVFTIAGS